MCCKFIFCCLPIALAVWPPPRFIQLSGPQRPLQSEFRFRTSHDSPMLALAMQRYTAIIAPTIRLANSAHANALRSVYVEVQGDAMNDKLDLTTNYSYTLDIWADRTEARITAATVFGAFYGLETFVQLLLSNGTLEAESVKISDMPQYPWRGLMIDSGRRFFPVSLVKNLLDTMAAVKLNVLHLHASDFCRFGVESKIYPELTAALVEERAGYYKQADIKELIAYARERGIRIVPEFDVPGHARGFLPLESHGIQFCSKADDRNQLYNDPGNSTFSVLKKLFGEMANLFEDDVFNIGCDETSAKNWCTKESLFSLERALVNTISEEFRKTPAGWEEILLDERAATQSTIVNSWTANNAPSITATGRRAVESNAGHFYFTDAVPGGPAGWSRCHYDISTGIPKPQMNLLLGGEMSMWSDRYCYVEQCGAVHGSAPVGHALFSPSTDEAFAKSIGGMIWPRGFVAAASFWNFNASVDPASAAFQTAIYKINDQLTARGSLVCPSHCSCDELTACGKSYLNDSSIVHFV